MPPNIMVALDLNHYWSCAPYELIDRLKRAGCTHYKVHDPLPGLNLRETAAHLRKAVLPGNTAVLKIDNKEDDIPSRVIKAVENHLRMGFDLSTVHAKGGREMLEALVKAGLAEHVVAVTALTSSKDKDILEITGMRRQELAVHLSNIAVDCGIKAGLVCGAPDIPLIKKVIPRRLPFLTPGIHLAGTPAADDQQAVATPCEAANFGSDIIILGRSIIESKTPELVFTQVKAELDALCA